MVGRDALTGPTARQKQKGVQCQKRIQGLDENGVIASPFVARTIQNYETTADNAFVREGLATPDEVLEMLLSHPARQKDMRDNSTGQTRVKPGRFVLVPYVQELTEEEIEMVHSGVVREEEVIPQHPSGTTIGPASAANAFPSADQINGEPDAQIVPGVKVVDPLHIGDATDLIV